MVRQLLGPRSRRTAPSATASSGPATTTRNRSPPLCAGRWPETVDERHSSSRLWLIAIRMPEPRQLPNGFVRLLGHPDLSHPAHKLARLYRQKDTIENLQTIRSAVKLRRIYHHPHPKVQAHVTLCMLALLLQRTLERRLRKPGVRFSFAAAMEVLRACHLNRVCKATGGQTIDLKAAETVAQQDILKALDLTHLVGDVWLATALKEDSRIYRILEMPHDWLLSHLARSRWGRP